MQVTRGINIHYVKTKQFENNIDIPVTPNQYYKVFEIPGKSSLAFQNQFGQLPYKTILKLKVEYIGSGEIVGIFAIIRDGSIHKYLENKGNSWVFFEDNAEAINYITLADFQEGSTQYYQPMIQFQQLFDQTRLFQDEYVMTDDDYEKDLIVFGLKAGGDPPVYKIDENRLDGKQYNVMVDFTNYYKVDI